MRKLIIMLILIMFLPVGCSSPQMSPSTNEADSKPPETQEKAEEPEEAAATVEPTQKPAEIPLTQEEKEMVFEVFHIDADEETVLGMHGTANIDGVLITLDEVVMLKGTDGEDLILPIWTAQNTNDGILNIFSHIMSNVIGPGNSMVDTVSRPESYPVESLSRIPRLEKDESASFYYYVSKYTPGYYVATMSNSEFTDIYYFVFEVE